MPATQLILASASPRRSELLGEAKVPFVVRPATVEELSSPPVALPAHFWVAALAYFKAASIARETPDAWILGADTIVTCAGELLGKPVDQADAARMLELQARHPSIVLTGVSLLGPRGSSRAILCDATRIWMHDRPDLRDAWLASGGWEGKAGGYGIQDVGDQLVSRCEGSMTNVVGLPLERVLPLLEPVRAHISDPSG